MNLYFDTDYFLRGVFLLIICLVLMIIFHECGHYLWDRLVTKVPSKLVITKVNGHWAFGAQATLPKILYSDVKENPKKYIRDRQLSRFAGIISIIPSITMFLLFPIYNWVFFLLSIGSMAYTYWETFYYHREHPWILFVNNLEDNPFSNEQEEEKK